MKNAAFADAQRLRGTLGFELLQVGEITPSKGTKGTEGTEGSPGSSTPRTSVVGTDPPAGTAVLLQCP